MKINMPIDCRIAHLNFLIAILSISSFANAEQPAVEVDTSIEQSFIDALSLADGRVVYLTARGPYLPDGEGRHVAFDAKSDVRQEFTGLFRDPRDDGAFYTASLLGAEQRDGLAINRYTKGKVQMVAFTREQLREPNYYQSRAGEIFVSSRSGVIYRFDGEQLHRFGLPWPQGERISFQKMFRRVDFASFPGGPTCAYSVADREYHKLALFDLLVTTETGWRKVLLKQKFTGPGCMSDANTFRMLLFDRWVNVDLKTEKVTEVKFPTVGDPADKLRATKVVAMPDGTMISIWRRPFRSFKKYDVDPFADGKYHRIAIWKDDRWELAPIGIDRQLYRPENHVIDKQGGLWLQSGEGSLVYRSPQGKWREFTHRHGLPVQGAMGLTLADERLILTYGCRGVTNVDRAKLLATDGASNSDWQVVYTQKPIGLGRIGDAPPLRSITGETYVVGPRGVTRFDSPDDVKTPRDSNADYVASDIDARFSDEINRKILSTCPLKRMKWSVIRGNGRSLAGDATQLAYYDGQRWATVTLAGCPFQLDLLRSIRREYGSASGRWLLEQKIDGIYRYAIYNPPGVNITQGEKDLGKVDSHEAPLKPVWTADAELKEATLRFHINLGEWSPWQAADQPIQPGAIAPPGEYLLHVQLHSPTQVLNGGAMTYHFQVTYDIRETIDALVKQLGDDDFTQRQLAMRQLQKVGPLVHDYLRELGPQQTDAEIQFRLRQVLNNRLK